MNKQYITRKTNLDCGHRVMNQKSMCKNLHGHTYLTELTFSFENIEEIGYAIDFKEIKRVFIQFLQDKFDHGFIANPKDNVYLNACSMGESKIWLMSLNGIDEYCNPTVENIAKEVFLAMDALAFVLYPNEKIGLKMHKVKIYETPNCWTECYMDSYTKEEAKNFLNCKFKELKQYAIDKGVIEYDDRKKTMYGEGRFEENIDAKEELKKEMSKAVNKMYK